jgi:hypothetical protein
MSNAATSKKPEAPDLGSIQNRLGILSGDFKKFKPEAFFEATGLTGTQLAKVLKVQRPLLYRESLPLKKLRTPIIQLVLATDLAFNLLANSIAETKRWLMSPNIELSGESPFEVILRGEGEEVVAWLLERSGKRPGTAF